MSKYPQLTDMGVLHPEQIDLCWVNSIDYVDVLRIVYVRPKGSVLPETRTYQFPRVQEESDNVAKGEEKTVMTTHSCLRKAIPEWDDLLATKGRVENVAPSIIHKRDVRKKKSSHPTRGIKKLLQKLPVIGAGG